MSATRGHIVQTPTKDEPYKVVLEHDDGPDTECPAATIREGEALIRDQTPSPAERDKSRDRPAPKAQTPCRQRRPPSM
jgi:hypothetical protein